MAEKWQKWMPFHIDRWRGSAHVQAMRAAARAGYLYLLASAWQTEDCSLPDDDHELQILAGLTPEEWTEFGPVIRRRFLVHEGKLYNIVLKEEWNEAKNKFKSNQAARSEAGKKGAAKRWDSKPIANAKQTLSKPIAKNGHIDINRDIDNDSTEKQKLSRAKRERDTPDCRHEPCRAIVQAYCEHKNVLFQWGGSAAKQLSILLSEAPDLTPDEFKRCLWNRARSPGVPHGEHPRIWLPHILKYQQGPLNEFGKTGGSHGTHFAGKTAQSRDAAQEAIDILAARSRARRENGANNSDPPEAWSSPASEARPAGLLDSGG